MLDKLIQMGSASVRVYQNGINTEPARQQLVLDYLNTVPLSAARGYGEVNGLLDGLAVWFGCGSKGGQPLLVSSRRRLKRSGARGVPSGRYSPCSLHTGALVLSGRG